MHPPDWSLTKAHVLEPNENEDFPLFKPKSFTQKTGLGYISLYSLALGRLKSHCQAVYSTPHRSMYDGELLSNKTFLSSDRSMVLERSLSDPDLHKRSFREGSIATQSASIVSNVLVPTFLPPSKATKKICRKSSYQLSSSSISVGTTETERNGTLQKDERKRVREDKAKAKREQSQTKRSRRNKKKDVSSKNYGTFIV